MSISLHNYEAVIFDMDGVLIDSEPLWKIAMEDVFSSFGSKLTRQDFQKTVGLRLDEVIEFWYHHEGWSGITLKEIENQIIEKMKVLISENGSPLNGVMETLDFLSERKIKVGLATSSYHTLIESVLNVLEVVHYFDVACSAEHEPYGKPHPCVYLKAAELLEVHPSKCLVIEDSLNGIISAKAAKMKVVCIPEKTHHPEPKLILADFHYENMNDLLQDLKTL